MSNRVCSWEKEDDTHECRKRRWYLVGDLVDQLLCDEVSLPRHLFEARWQQMQFTSVSENPPFSSIVIVMDFAEKYTCMMQEEVQSAHWYINSITIHPFVGYYKCPNNDCDVQKPVCEDPRPPAGAKHRGRNGSHVPCEDPNIGRNPYGLC